MLNSKDVRIQLTARNEGISYQDGNGLFLHFDVLLENGRWQIFLPGSRGPGFTSYVMSPEERDMVVPRIAAFLKKVKWFGLFPRTYVVEVIEKD